MKYIVITGGVISGLGKGITAASIGAILKGAGYKTTMIKIDPYINVDAGTMSPFEHGEVFVLNDGSETDLDLGNYERFLNINLTGHHNITTGKVYKSVIDDERKGKYLGQTVQIIPHITNRIQELIINAAYTPINKNKDVPEICIIEVGGTIGDIESMPFIEAIRQLNYNNNSNEMCFIHVSLVPKIGRDGESKTKPTQNSIKDLRQLGLFPDIMIVRSDTEIDVKTRDKISMFSQVPENNIISNPNVNSIYEVTINFDMQNIGNIICNKLDLIFNKKAGYLINIKDYTSLYLPYNDDKVDNITIGIVGKYTTFTDSYLSIVRALEHAGYYNKCKINIKWLSSENINLTDIDNCNGIIIPGGFGNRGINGMLLVAKFCREKNIPILGICLGMHIMCIEAARQIYGFSCNSEEFEPDAKHPIISIVDEDNKNMGGTMKLGLHKTYITKSNNGSLTTAYKCYSDIECEQKKDIEYICERHRHRYEVNPKYREDLSSKLFFSGKDTEEQCIDIVEITNHKFYIGCQYHPEFQSYLHKPSPLFNGLVKTCLKNPIMNIVE